MVELWQAQCPLSVLQQRAFLYTKIREFFQKRHVLEVETPILSSAGNTDVHIESFHSENIDTNFSHSYLRTSAEFPMKRLLCSGYGDVYELGKVFRRGEHSTTHNCEFTMLEWYRLNFDYKDLMEEVIQLFECLLSAFQHDIPVAQTFTFAGVFQTFLGIDIFSISVPALNQTCQVLGYCGSQLEADAALDYLFATQIQGQLNPDNLTFISHFPASQAALAEICPDNPNTALRFEVFYQGFELGNGYQELTDATELSKRFVSDNQKRQADGLKPVQIDTHLIAAMTQAMPKCSGIAIGIDRLLMLLLKMNSIHEVMPFNALNA